MRGRRPWLVLAVLGTAAALAACSLFTDLSSLDEAPPPPDAGASADVITNAETGVPTDSGSADTGAKDAGGCDAAFCDDFDEATTAGDGWDTTSVVNGTLALETTTVVSPPNALRAQLGVDGGSDGRSAMMRKDLPAGGKVTCSFSALLGSGITDATREVDLIRIEAADPTVTAHRFNLALRGPFTENMFFNGSVRDDLTFLDGGCACPRTHEYFPGPPVAKWIRVVFSVDFANGATSASFDDVLAFSGGSYPKLAPTRTTVFLGLASRTTSGPVVMFDDLRCSVE